MRIKKADFKVVYIILIKFDLSIAISVFSCLVQKYCLFVKIKNAKLKIVSFAYLTPRINQGCFSRFEKVFYFKVAEAEYFFILNPMSFDKKTRKKIKSFFIFIIFFSCLAIAISAPLFSLLQGEIVFHTDIARDFLLMQEAVEKKIMLIGPRASGLEGFFHGPLWIYMNLPFYIIGAGEPVAIGIGWLVITFASVFLLFYLAGRMRIEKIILPALALFLVVFADQLNSLFNPHGALFFLPLYVLLFFQYLRSGKERFLFASMLVLGAIIHLQIAVAGPIFILSFPLAVWVIWRNRSFMHLRSFSALFIATANYFLFDLRHNFQLSKAVYKYIFGKTSAIPLDLKTTFSQRLNLLINKGIYLFDYPLVNKAVFFLFLFTAVFIIFKVKKKKVSHWLFLLFLYFYIGFYALSLLHKGWLLGHYFLPVLSFPIFLVVLGMRIERFKFIYTIIFLSSLFFWSYKNINYIRSLDQIIGKNENSWRYQYKVAKTVFDDGEDEFGFFIFSPDIFAYQSKAAVNYFMNKYPEKKVKIYEKDKITYLIIAPAPEKQPWLNYKGWKKLKVKLEKEPIWSKTIPPVGYQVQKYILTEEDLQVSPDPNINDWIYFR